MSCPDCNKLKRGPRGPMGLQGPAGEQGVSGVPGIQGPQGPQGIQGLTGPKGDSGNDGNDGAQGIPGIQGPPGVPGRDGDQGPAGIDGQKGEDGAQGPQGEQGIQGPVGPAGIPGPAGPAGNNGRVILGAYNNTTGVGNLNPIGEDQLFLLTIPAATLALNGDELEISTHIEYRSNDLVNMKFKLDGANEYTYAVQNPDDELRNIKIKIARIDKVNQLWTIEDVVKDTVGGGISIKTLETFTTTYNLDSGINFEILADNTVIGANQVVLKKAVVYKNSL